MAARKTTATGEIDPGLLYTLERLAASLGVTARFIRENYINQGELDAMEFGRSYLIPGETFITFVHRFLDDHRKEG